MSGDIPERTVSAIRRATAFHGIAFIAALVAAIVLTTNLPRMDGSGIAKVVVFWVTAFFSFMLPIRLMRRSTNAALKQVRAGTCVVAALCLACVGLMIHSLVVDAQRGVEVDSLHALSIALSLGLSMFAFFVHASATQMISEVTIRHRINNLRASLHAASTKVGKRASMVISKRSSVGGDWQEKRDKKLRDKQQKQEQAASAATQEAIQVTVSK